MKTGKSSSKRSQQGWRILVIFTTAALIISLAWTIASTPLYRASASFLIYPNTNLTSSRDVVSSLDTLDKRTISATYADIMVSSRVYNDTIQRLQLEENLLKNIRVNTEVQSDTNILILNVEGADPNLITLLANNIGQNGISLIKSIYQVFDISFLDLAVEPTKPFRPRPITDSLIAAGAGLLLGLVFLFLRETLSIPLETLRERANTDKQSLAFTRKYLNKSLIQELIKKKEEPLALSLIYLQGLEDLADGLPERHLIFVMQSVVQRLHAMLRGNDIVARWDGLVFSVMLPSTPEVPATRTIERLLASVKEPVQIGTGESIPLNPLSGLALSQSGDTVNNLTERAENALEQARQSNETLVFLK